MAANLDTIVERESAGLEQFVTSYRPLPDIFDEMMDADRRLRAHWRPFLGTLASLGTEEINRRFAAADRYLRGSGVFYRVYEDAAGIERPWPLSHVPLIIEPGEWRRLEAGLIERAGLLEAVLADAYGPSLLSRDGRLPAALIAGNPEFLRPLVGVKPPGPAESAINERVEASLRIMASLSGLAQENMTQLAGWRFIELGRRIERAIITSRLVRCFALAGAPDGGLEVLLELVDSQITYRQRYVMVAARALVIDLAMLDPNNPRSVAFQLDRIETHLSALPGRHAAGRLSPVQQVATALATRLRTVEAAAIDEALIIDTEQSLMMLSDAITAAYLTNNERSEPAWEALA